MTIRGIPNQSRDVIMYSWLSLYICLCHHHPHHRTEVAAVTVAERCFVSLRWFLYSCTCDSRHSQLRGSCHLGSPKVAATTTNEIGLVHVLKRVLGLWRVCRTVKLPCCVVPPQTKIPFSSTMIRSCSSLGFFIIFPFPHVSVYHVRLPG